MRSALATALLLSLASGPAIGQVWDSPTSAVATGLAIPIAGVPSHASPVPARGRTALVDAASATLFMIENGRVVDSMRVIVGKPTAATPTLRGTLYYATLNPYWNVPVDLARTLIAPRVLERGPAYLAERGYEVVSGFTRDPTVLSPEDVDWHAVADGRAKVYVRQRPGPANSMGQMKFGFQNNHGIFLHDTPKKELFAGDNRNLSNGCIRLEDAPRFARWLLGRDPASLSATPEQAVALPRPVPIVIDYLDTAASMRIAALR